MYRRSPHVVWSTRVAETVTRGEIVAEGRRPEHTLAARRAAVVQTRLRRINKVTLASFLVLAHDLSAEEDRKSVV